MVPGLVFRKLCLKPSSLMKLFISLLPLCDISSLRTECARDRDLYELVSCHKFVNEKFFCKIYKTLYLTLGHHAPDVILCLCLKFFWAINSWNVFAKPKKLKKLGVQYFCLWRSGSLAHLVWLDVVQSEWTCICHSKNVVYIKSDQNWPTQLILLVSFSQRLRFLFFPMALKVFTCSDFSW